MSLRPHFIGPVPEETVREAQAVFRKENLYLRLREALGTIYGDDMFANLFPTW
jgi:transposase